LTLASGGDRLFVTTAEPAGSVLELKLPAGEVLRRISVGHTPLSPVLHPDGATLYVCNRFSNDVGVVDLETGAIRGRIPVPREPIAAALTPDGSLLVVANHLPAGAANGDYTGAEVTLVDTVSERPVASIPLPNGSTSLRGVCVSPDGRHAYATHILGRYGLPTTQLDRGWVNTNAMSVVDLGERKLLATVLLDDVDRGAANPWGVACSADGARLCVAHSGTHEISVIDRPRLHEKLALAVASKEGIEVSADLAFLVDLRRRVGLAGNGPRGLAIAGERVLVAQHFGDSVGVVELSPEPGTTPRSIPLAPPRPLNPARRGELLFHDAEICFQSWQSCASCHPDGRADGLNWDLLNDGLGNPRNTKSLLLSHRTPPSMITGVRDTAETAVRSGLRHIHFTVPSKRDAADIDAYLSALLPVASPHLVEGDLSAAARRGEQVFQSAGCAACHPAPLYTDLRGYDVGLGEKFDTPALVEVWRTAPYLSDGRAATLRDALATHEGLMREEGEESLTEGEVDDLAAYVSTR